jgi:hypothetical protein
MHHSVFCLSGNLLTKVAAQVLSQAQTGSQQAGFNGRPGQVEHLGCFLDGQPLKISQDKDNAQDLGEALDGLIENSTGFGRK